MAQEDFIPIGEVKQEVKEEEEEGQKKTLKKPKQEVKKKAKREANTNTGVIYLGKPFYHFTLDVHMNNTKCSNMWINCIWLWLVQQFSQFLISWEINTLAYCYDCFLLVATVVFAQEMCICG